jgi:Protein of unknown function (DUF3500)
MKLHRVLLALLAVAVVAGLAYVGQVAEPAGSKMAAAGQKFVDSLKKDQKEQAVFEFDDKERTRWFFTPQQDQQKKSTRKGLPLEQMTEEQRKAALELVRAGTSNDGYTKATTIMSLESILHDLEKGGAMVRNPQWYFFSVFGTPSKTGKWGWRVEGHHLSLNFTLDGGKVVSSTPAFFGANPATVKDGDRKGLRTLPEAEDSARELFNSLDKDQKATALQQKPFGETPENSKAPNVGEPVGLPAAKMTDKQRGILTNLIQGYAARMPEDIAEVEMKQVKEAGLDKVHFAYTGGTEDGQGHTYRVQGPTFVIEFLNMQADSAKNPANHIHSSWRNIKGDFGLTGN